MKKIGIVIFFVGLLLVLSSYFFFNQELLDSIPTSLDRTYGGGYSNTNKDDVIVGRVKGHKYAIVSTFEDLKEYKNMVTYVLFPKDKSSALLDRTTRRYQKILNLIQELPKTNENVSLSKSKRNNKFIVMGKKNNIRVTVNNYNYILAGDILEFFEDKANVLFTEDGPYLITTIDNPFDGTDKFSFLYVNLSHFNDSGVKEILESYKRRLQYTGSSEFGFLEKLKAKVLVFAMNSNDNIESFTEVFTTRVYAKD